MYNHICIRWTIWEISKVGKTKQKLLLKNCPDLPAILTSKLTKKYLPVQKWRHSPFYLIQFTFITPHTLYEHYYDIIWGVKRWFTSVARRVLRSSISRCHYSFRTGDRPGLSDECSPHTRIGSNRPHPSPRLRPTKQPPGWWPRMSRSLNSIEKNKNVVYKVYTSCLTRIIYGRSDACRNTTVVMSISRILQDSFEFLSRRRRADPETYH